MRNAVREFRRIAAEVAKEQRQVNDLNELLIHRQTSQVFAEVKNSPEKVKALAELLFSGVTYVPIYAAEILMRLKANGVDISLALPAMKKAYDDPKSHFKVKAYLGAAANLD
ncbi:MAG: hypothetical protein Q7S22_01665 [Candidatus Micrarchaeota archaeon]|nr:hypothetical protein [Candidatus Micrarchaeota archaeon]